MAVQIQMADIWRVEMQCTLHKETTLYSPKVHTTIDELWVSVRWQVSDTLRATWLMARERLIELINLGR